MLSFEMNLKGPSSRATAYQENLLEVVALKWKNSINHPQARVSQLQRQE